MPILSQQKQSQAPDFPNLRPSLDLRFALAKKLDPRITFTRGSTGTYFGSDGLMRTADVNVPRFDHDPVTGQSLGLLIEESRQNLITGSEDFGTNWSKINSVGVSTNIITAPDGTLTADKFRENNLSVGSAAHKVIGRNFTLSASTTYTFSVFIKAAERTNIMMHLRKSDFGVRFGGFFNLTTRTFTNETTAGATLLSSSIIALPNDWYRISVTGDIGTNTDAATTLYLCNTSNSISYAGDGVSGVYLWGAQLEVGASPTSYIPTTASTVTRSADLASMTGTNFSSWYNQSEGSIISNCNRPYAVPSSNFISVVGISNGTIGSNYNAINIGYLTEGLFSLETYKSNTRIVAMYPGSSNIRTRISGVSYNQTTDVYYIFTNNKTSGSAIHRSDKQNIDFGYDMNTLNIGNTIFGSSSLCGTISRLTYYPIQLTNQQLINLTS
jgi:hypothetical protein